MTKICFCSLLIAAGSDGVIKVIEKFIHNHPLFAKRQIEMKISEIAVKEKRPEDATKVTTVSFPF